jgi:hypothetical protein
MVCKFLLALIISAVGGHVLTEISSYLQPVGHVCVVHCEEKGAMVPVDSDLCKLCAG